MQPRLWSLLKPVSRSLYLSLRALPEPVREGMAVGYLLCRAADTIADTRLFSPEQRLRLLAAFRALCDAPADAATLGAIQRAARPGASGPERALIESLPECWAAYAALSGAERALVRDVVHGVCEGMRLDLETFPSENSGAVGAFKDARQLEAYCRFIGGKPGEFWTRLCLLKLPALSRADGPALIARGVRLGEGLQITNILRDVAADARLGRCYLPAPELAAAGLKPKDLLSPGSLDRLKPVLRPWIGWGLERLESGADYVRGLPAWHLRLRAGAAWPLLLAVRTLGRINRSRSLLDPKERERVSRSEVYGMLLATPFTLGWNGAFDRTYAGALASAQAR